MVVLKKAEEDHNRGVLCLKRASCSSPLLRFSRLGPFLEGSFLFVGARRGVAISGKGFGTSHLASYD